MARSRRWHSKFRKIRNSTWAAVVCTGRRPTISPSYACCSINAQNHIGDLNVTKLPTAVPPLSNEVELYLEQDKKWGLSFLINTQRTAEGRSPGSLAWAGLANTYFWLDTTRNIGVILMQLLPFFDKTALDLFATFERGVYDSLDTTKAAAEVAVGSPSWGLAMRTQAPAQALRQPDATTTW
jgi:CubicO group peptidase (beta-lactamase class C family)